MRYVSAKLGPYYCGNPHCAKKFQGTGAGWDGEKLLCIPCAERREATDKTVLTASGKIVGGDLTAFPETPRAFPPAVKVKPLPAWASQPLTRGPVNILDLIPEPKEK